MRISQVLHFFLSTVYKFTCFLLIEVLTAHGKLVFASSSLCFYFSISSHVHNFCLFGDTYFAISCIF